MADRFAREIDIPDVTSAVSVPVPPVGAISLYGRNGKLAVLEQNGTETILERMVTPRLTLDGGNAMTTQAEVRLRIDFGPNGASA